MNEDTPASRYCEDCTPILLVQGGAWGWQAHRFQLHGEGQGPPPDPAVSGRATTAGRHWTPQEHEQFHQQRRALRRQQHLQGRRRQW